MPMEVEEEGPLPGFRFHPTDEELVGFYLKRKVEKRPPLSIEIIKHMDIYKHDPWDLAKASSVVDGEWYFYCKRGRKYRNSIRPNRVTGSGFWKATGIDRPIYSNGGEGGQIQCIGLKKSLVYYRGSAGKGTKTDWMMHEFRLPTSDSLHPGQANFLSNSKDATQEAEIWTLCRIFKRSKRQTPDWRELSAKKNTINASSKTSTMDDSNTNKECYISFATHPRAPSNNNDHSNIDTMSISDRNEFLEDQNFCVSSSDQKMSAYFHPDYQHDQHQWSNATGNPTSTTSCSSSLTLLADEENHDLQSFTCYEYNYNWDDLSSVVELANRTPSM